MCTTSLIFGKCIVFVFAMGFIDEIICMSIMSCVWQPVSSLNPTRRTPRAVWSRTLLHAVIKKTRSTMSPGDMDRSADCSMCIYQSNVQVPLGGSS